LANYFSDFSDELNKIPKNIEAHVKENKIARKNLLKNGSTLTAELHKREKNHQALQLKYRKSCQKRDESIDEYNRSKTTQNASIISKLGKKAESETKEAEKSDKNYMEAVDALKLIQEKIYLVEMPAILKDLQAIDETRIKNTKGYFENILTSLELLSPGCATASQSVSTAVGKIDYSADIGTFVKKNVSQQASPQFVVYEAYDSNNPKTSDPIPTTTSTPTPTTPISTPTESKKEPAKSTTSFFGSKKGSTNTSTPATLSTSNTTKIVPSTTKKQTCKALYDYDATDENEVSFKANDIINLLQKHESGWWQGEINGKTGMFPSNFVEEILSSSSTKTEAPPVENVKKIRALYDYEGKDDGELPMTEGDVLNFESEKEGWYFCFNSKNDYGRVPSNYVEFL